MKLKVSGNYRFKTAEVYPRWSILCLEEPFLRDGNEMRIVRLDHRFKHGEKWEWLTSNAVITQWCRTEMARLLGALRSEILYVKRQEMEEGA